MREDEFNRHFSPMNEWMNFFFHRKIKESKLNEDIEELKKDLIQTTVVEVWTRLQEMRYIPYQICTLIRIKARDVWRDTLRANTRNSVTYLPEEELDELSAVGESGTRYENMDFIEHIHADCDHDTWNMIALLSEGESYAKIAENFKKSEGSIKMRIFRFRKGIDPNKFL